MQNKEAARYARWSAGAAIAIVLVVAGVFVRGRFSQRAARKNLPPPVPATVAQQSAGFTFSRVVKNNRTLFTVHASQATEFKDKNRSLLENVSITIYGLQGDRNDSVRASECSYEPDTGSIRCQGTVQIDLQDAAKDIPPNRSAEGMHFETSDILFDRDSGKVSTKNKVTVRFAGGEGSGTGIIYDPQTEEAKLEANVQLKMAPENSRTLPVNLAGSALEFRRSERTLELFGPVRAEQGERVLTAGKLEVGLDAKMRLQIVRASGESELNANNARGAASLAADQMEAVFGNAGALDKIIADGNVHGGERSTKGASRIAAGHLELTMAAKRGNSEPREILASGDAHVEMQQGSAKRDLRTEKLRINFTPKNGGRGVRVESAETLAPAEMITSDQGESNTIHGGKLTAAFDAKSQLTELRGASGVRVIHQESGKPPQTTTAQNLTAAFGAGGEWETIQENGGVKFEQGGRTGQAESAEISRAENKITLDGSASVADSTSRISAARIDMDQKTSDFYATGNVVASYFGNGASLKSVQTGATNISADQMSGSSAAGRAIFSGNARFWQGDDVLQAQTIEFWRDEKRAEARGNVEGAFLEPARSAAKENSYPKINAPTVWQVHAPKVVYSNDSGTVELSGGVTAKSSEGSISSQTLKLFLSTAGNQRQRLERAVAEGDVRIEQNGRTGVAERGEYVAKEGKFVLSGGQPALSDGSGNTTTGRELTFFLASDTILVDSQKGPRTITKHRVEK